MKENYSTTEITCSCGKIKGRQYSDHIEFRGIKYAQANRWEYSKQINTWNGIYDATEFKECCIQRRSYEDDEVCNEFYHNELRQGLISTYSEDCLHLNIFSPKDAKNCAVIIFIHGGSFTDGSSDEAYFDGTELTKQNVILVTFNYRLGPFGFCSHPDLTDKNGVCGNYGIQDQYTAIKWVKENILSFGGNPNNITLMGQSAGAMSVDIHSSSSLETNWFSGLIFNSGAGLQRLILKPLTPKKTKKFWEEIIRNAKVNSIEELKHVDSKTLFYAWFNAKKKPRYYPCTLPTYDGLFVIKKAFTKKTIPIIPTLIGITKDDLLFPFQKLNTKRWSKFVNSKKKIAFTYFFRRNLPGDDKGAWHSSDLLYFFSCLHKNWRPFEKIDYTISDQMSATLATFAKTQNPSSDKTSNWKPDFKRPMIFCENTRQDKWNTKD